MAVNGITPPFYNLVSRGTLAAPVFSMRFGESDADGGEIVFGGVDETAYTGAIDYVPVRRKSFWEVELERFTFGDMDSLMEDTGAAIDSGTSLILVPAEVAAKINAQCGLSLCLRSSLAN